MHACLKLTGVSWQRPDPPTRLPNTQNFSLNLKFYPLMTPVGPQFAISAPIISFLPWASNHLFFFCLFLKNFLNALPACLPLNEGRSFQNESECCSVTFFLHPELHMQVVPHAGFSFFFHLLWISLEMKERNTLYYVFSFGLLMLLQNIAKISLSANCNVCWTDA